MPLLFNINNFKLVGPYKGPCCIQILLLISFWLEFNSLEKRESTLRERGSTIGHFDSRFWIGKLLSRINKNGWRLKLLGE